MSFRTARATVDMWGRKIGPLGSGGETPPGEATVAAWRACYQGRRYRRNGHALGRDPRELPAEASLDLMPLRQVRRAKQRDRPPRTPHAPGAADTVREEQIGRAHV